jgi:hypothetical protein
MQNFNVNTLTILAALQAEGFNARLEKEGASNKKHQLLGVVVCFVDNAEQYVCPAYTDLATFELNPIRLREGKLIVGSSSVGTADSGGHKWFESIAKDFKGELFPVSLEPVTEEYTPQPIIEPVVPVVSKAEAAANASEAVNATPAAA